MSENIEDLKQTLLGDIDAAGDPRALEEVRIAALGKKGRVSELMKGLGKMEPGRAQRNGPQAERAQN